MPTPELRREVQPGPLHRLARWLHLVRADGTVRVRLNRVTAANAPATVWMGLGLGTPSGEDCSATTSLNTQASEVAQITGTYAPGIYCAKVYDIGNLLMPASFYVTIDHP